MRGAAQTRPWKRAALKIGGSVVILALLFSVLPFREVLSALASVPLRVWGAALGLYFCLHVIGVLKWRMLVNASGGDLSFGSAIRCYYSGLFGNTFLPSIVGGDIIRIGMALRLCSNRGAVLFGSFVDRSLDILGLGFVAGIGALLLPNHLDEQSRRIFVGLMLLFAVGGAVALIACWAVPARRFPFGVRRKLVKGRRVVRALVRQPGYVLTALVLGMGLQTLLTLLNAWLGLSVGIDVAFGIWLFVWPLAKIAGIVPVSQGGLGIREAAQVALFLPFGVPAVAAMATGLVFEAIIISGGLLGGLLALLLGRASPRSGTTVTNEPPRSGSLAPAGEGDVARSCRPKIPTTRR